MKSKYLHIAFAALVLALSCTKEQEGAEPVVRGDYDPVVRFGLETYLDFSEPATKTAYAGDNKTILLNNVRYERIDWDVTADPDVDVVQILSEQDFTKYDKKEADYKAKKIEGRTNNSTTKEDVADTEPYDGDVKKAFYWSAIKEDRYFYAVYPSPNTTNSKAKNFAIKSASTHTATVEGEIPGNQPYKGIKTTGTPGLSGSPASIEYLPDMTNAYMYAAAKVDKADAGYDKVPLRFKPLFSAVKLIVTARDAGAKNYRLKKVELRTDLHYDDVYLRPNNPNGTALGGKFKASFGLASGGKTTGDFTVDPDNDLTDTLRRLTIDIPEGQRYLLNEDTLKVTFLALPVEQQYLVVDYTFECLKDPLADPSDPNNWKEVRRILALQDRKKIFKTTDKESWYKLEKAHKLYVRSGVPEIEYHFKVQSQSFLPRVWRSNCPETVNGSNVFLAQDFYSVVSYRDSSGVLQPLKWQVTGYNKTSATGPFTDDKPTWLFLRGENGSYNPDNDKAVFFDPNQTSHPEYGYANNGITPSDDPWAKAWGYGSHMDDSRKKYNNGFFCGYEGFKNNHSGVFFNAGGTNNGTALKDWLVDENQLITYNYCDPDGNYYYTEDRGTHKAGEAYAYDLSSHDIYGNLYPLKKNGDLVTTANCYVVSAPGWYRFPAVYGNAFKNGDPNPDAYTGKDGPNLLHAFLDCNDADITQPWIPGINKGNNGRDGVSLVWEDATDMIYAGTFADANRAEELEPFYWEDPAGHGYIYFYVNQIAWSNAVIAAKSDDGNGTTVWSWHIWCVPDPRNTLEEIAIEPNETFGGGTGYSTAANAINAPEFFVRYSTVRANTYGNFQNGDDFVYKSRYGKTTVWQLYDLGQGGAETDSSPYKHCYVEFTQYWRGKAIAKRVVCMAQSGVKDTTGLADVPFYQWGRKDPLPTSGESVYADLSQASTSTIGTTIQNPATLYYGTSSYAPSGTSRYDNLWNTAVDYTTSTFLKFDTDGTKPGGRKDLPVVKTIYDPCPPGYSMPNLFAFTAFNPLGLFQTKISLNRIAFDHTATYLSGYHDLSTKYDGSQTFRRDITESTYNAGEFVRFYFRGRRNGNTISTAGSIDQKNTGHYWLAEPASNKSTDNTGTWSYGSVFIFQGQSGNSQSQVYPVAGGEDIDNTKTPPVAVSSPKWQRTHACSVRPMKEQ